MTQLSIASLQYHGTLTELRRAALAGCGEMQLTCVSYVPTPDGFSIDAKEKLWLFLTSRPVSFHIAARSESGMICLIVSATSAATSKLPALTQNAQNRRRAQELLALIRSLAPGRAT